jgi:hypothetical protein
MDDKRHTHTLETEMTKYTVITTSPEWDWHDFFKAAVTHDIIMIRTETKLPDGKRAIREFTCDE